MLRPQRPSEQLANEATEDDASALRERLEAAIAERDLALTALAKERELTNALRLGARNRGEPDPPPYPRSAGLGAPPLRYVLADAANDVLKAWVGPLQRVAKRLAKTVSPRAGEE